MRFLADESCDFSVVRTLRSAGHDVAAIAEVVVEWFWGRCERVVVGVVALMIITIFRFPSFF